MKALIQTLIACVLTTAFSVTGSFGQQVENGTAQIKQSADAPASEKLPRLVDLGAGKCIPCKMMKPILDELKRDYASKFTTEFLDVWEKPDAAKPYRIQIIPTQIFFDASGKELFRHEGFFSKDEILAKWKELGVDPKGSK